MSRNDDFRRDVTRTQVPAPDGELTPRVTSTTSAALPPRGLFESGASFGRYRITALLGSGGLGDVYRARDTRLERDVALKVLRPRGFGDKSADRLLREARAAATLDHPNAVRVFDVGEIDGLTFLAMELVDGKPLRAFIGDETLAMDLRLSWLIQIASALEAAHREGIVHRDVKPDNVMVRSDGVVKVVDFGIAHIDDDEKRTITISRAGIAIGTPAYMAPEQVRGERLDARCDQFAWGVLAYEMLSGRRPWSGSSIGAIAQQILSHEPAPLSNVPDSVARVIERALAKRRDDRFPSMSPILALLDLGSEEDESARKHSAGSRFAWLSFFILLAACTIAMFNRTTSYARLDSKTTAAPHSPRSAAIEAFERGQLSFYEGSIAEARSEFNLAAELDPGNPSAHLWAGLLANEPDSSMREHLQRASAFRQRLSEHQRRLLFAAEPWMKNPTDWVGSEKLLERLTETYPEDTEAWFFLGWVRWRKLSYVSAAAAFEKASSLNERFGSPLVSKAEVCLLGGDETCFRETLSRCLESAPASTGCIRLLDYQLGADGECANGEVVTRRLIALAPNTALWYRALANFRFAQNGDLHSARHDLAAVVERLPPSSRADAQAEFDADLLILEGKFEDADKAVVRWEELIRNSPEEWLHMEPARTRWYIAMETGRNADVVRLADEYLRKQAAWSPNDFEADTRFYAMSAKYLAGATGRATLAKERSEWLGREHLRASKRGERWPSFFTWLLAFPQSVKSTEDALEAVTALPWYGVLYANVERGIIGNYWLGRAHRRAGRYAEAEEYLGDAVRSCEAINFPFQRIWAFHEYGMLLEQKGRNGEACEAYAKVLERWSSAATVSVTAREAVARRVALRCVPVDASHSSLR